MLSTGLIIISLLVIGIWILVEVKRMRHKIFAIFLIALILFTYLSFSAVLKNNDLDFKSVSGMTKATKLYFVWLGSSFGNLKVLTMNAVNMNWSAVPEKNKTNSSEK